jgi:D-beta-D-heptose 7-phosphate kinase/D-beta-D-heptose 1-phosphate adenosyltransferase
VLEVEREEYKLGGAANVAACLAALGTDVRLCGIVGADQDGSRLDEEARRLNIDVSTLIADPERPTTCKTRIVARHQQIIRLDRETREPLDTTSQQRLLKRLRSTIDWSEGIVLSDYGKGVLTEPICRSVIEWAGERPIVVDPKQLPWDKFRGATVIKPNRSETEDFVQHTIDNHEAAIHAGQQLSDALVAPHVLITRGADGMSLISRSAANHGPNAVHFASQPRDLIDVTGAGDVVAATLTTALAAGAHIASAAWLSNIAAGIKVGKFGAAGVTGKEMLSAIGAGDSSFARSVLSRSAAASLAEDWRKQGKRVVFTNGCFDLLHLGHVTYLEQSRQKGDALIVGVNSDASVRRLKGPSRPLQNESDRAQILASLASVDAVVVFDESTPYELIRAIRPDVLTKGADYQRKENVVGWDLLESWGGQVALIDLVDGRSTTRLANSAA